MKYAGIEELYGAIHPDDRERFQKIFETALQREMKGTAEYRLRQGKRIWKICLFQNLLSEYRRL